MKYKDIADLFSDESTQVRTALRVYRCRPEIREEIDRLLATETEPEGVYEIGPASHPELKCSISVQSLIHDYGLTPLDALIFLDWALRSDMDMRDAFSALLHRVLPPREQEGERPVIEASPEVQEEYERIAAELSAEDARLKQEYLTIADRQIHE